MMKVSHEAGIFFQLCNLIPMLLTFYTSEAFCIVEMSLTVSAYLQLANVALRNTHTVRVLIRSSSSRSVGSTIELGKRVWSQLP